MRIGFDATAALRQGAGVGRFARGLLSGLAGLDRRNEYVLLAVGKARRTLAATEVPSRSVWLRLPVPERAANVAWQRWRLPLSPATLMGRLSLLFTPDYLPPPTGRVQVALTVHDLSFLIHPECAEASLRRFLTRAVPRAVRDAAATVAVSQTTAQAIRELLGVPAERIHVVPNGVGPQFSPLDATAAPPDQAAARLAAKLRSAFDLEPGYLLTLGTLEPRRNLVRLLEAFSLVRRRAPAAAGRRLVVAGREGWLYEPIFRAVARLGLRDSVRFLTRAEDRDLPDLYRGAAGFVYPSLYEGFGIPPLEAMACGVPVAASTGGALTEVLGEAALSFDPLDVEGMAGAVERLLGDDRLRAALAERGVRRAAAFTWEGSAAGALALFERLAA